MLHHIQAFLINGLGRAGRLDQTAALRHRNAVDISQDPGRLIHVRLIVKRPSRKPLHHQEPLFPVTEQGLWRPPAGDQGLEGRKLIADLVLQVHLAARIDPEHQLFPCPRMDKAVIHIIFSLAQEGKHNRFPIRKPQCA